MYMDAASAVRDDFDRIAALEMTGWDSNVHYHAFLLKHLPTRVACALDIGCGTGAFARALAERADHVLAIDLSPRMIERARARSAAHSNIEYRVADLLTDDLGAEPFDCITTIATMHHVPLAPALERMRCALVPGGTLAILDLVRSHGALDRLRDVIALPVQAMLRTAHTGRPFERREVRAAWAEHTRNEHYPTLDEAAAAMSALLPGVRVRRHLLWRYSAIWRKE